MKSKIFNLKFLIAIFIIVAILTVAIVLLVINSQTANFVEVSVNGKIVETISLDVDKTVEINCENGYNIINIKNHIICVIEADCFGHDCVLMGYQNKVGQTIVCLPHKMVIELKRK